MLRVSVVDPVGRTLAARYGVRAVPTFVLLDGAGQVVLVQAGRVDREAVLATVDTLP